MDDFITEDMKLAVKRGAVWMDENHPGWVGKIDLDQLDMRKCRACIIGQTLGSYYTAIEKGAIDSGLCPSSSSDWAIEHGFDTPWRPLSGDDPEDYAVREYRKLETLWTDQVDQRLG